MRNDINISKEVAQYISDLKDGTIKPDLFCCNRHDQSAVRVALGLIIAGVEHVSLAFGSSASQSFHQACIQSSPVVWSGEYDLAMTELLKHEEVQMVSCSQGHFSSFFKNERSCQIIRDTVLWFAMMKSLVGKPVITDKCNATSGDSASLGNLLRMIGVADYWPWGAMETTEYLALDNPSPPDRMCV